MSKAALYKGLGVGLMSFGDNLGRQMAESARARREESLAALKRQWQLEDKADDREFQVGLLDRQEETAEQERQFKIDEQNRADAIKYGRENQEWERGAPERNARVGLLEAQTEAATDRNRTPQNRIDLYDRFYEDLVSNQGKSPEEADAEATRRVQELFSTPSRAGSDSSSNETALRMATDALEKVDMGAIDPAVFGISEDTPASEHFKKILDFYQSQLGGNQQAGNGSRNSPIPVESLSGPDDLVPGHFYMVNGDLRQWTGDQWR